MRSKKWDKGPNTPTVSHQQRNNLFALAAAKITVDFDVETVTFRAEKLRLKNPLEMGFSTASTLK